MAIIKRAKIKSDFGAGILTGLRRPALSPAIYMDPMDSFNPADRLSLDTQIAKSYFTGYDEIP
jgi:hypothetical protein